MTEQQKALTKGIIAGMEMASKIAMEEYRKKPKDAGKALMAVAMDIEDCLAHFRETLE